MSPQPHARLHTRVRAHTGELFVHICTYMEASVHDFVYVKQYLLCWTSPLVRVMMVVVQRSCIQDSFFLSFYLLFFLVTYSGEYDAKCSVVLTSPPQYLTSSSYARLWVLFHYPLLSLSVFFSLSCLWVLHRLVTWPLILLRRILAHG